MKDIINHYSLLETRVLKLKGNIGHKCKVMHFDEALYVEGTIIGVAYQRHSGPIRYMIHLDDGRYVGENYDSLRLEIDDDVYYGALYR